MRIIVLGSGTSFGVPVVGCGCAVCVSNDPHDRRTRAAALIETDDGHRILIDTPPELRLQLLGAAVDGVDAVIYTHDHADHVHGIDDLRAVSARNGELPLYGAAGVLDRIKQRFTYIFDPAVVPPRGTSKPELTLHPIEAARPVEIAGTQVLPLAFDHGTMEVFGYRVGPVAYVTDVKTVPPAAIDALRGVRVLILNALFEQPHPTHLSIPEAIEVAGAVGASATYLTHLTHRYAHTDLSQRLPEGIEPAYDGLRITL